MSQSSAARPPFDPAYQLSGGLPGFLDLEDVQSAREWSKSNAVTGDAICERLPYIQFTDLIVPTAQGQGSNTATLAFFQHKSSNAKNRAVIYYVHGGGQVFGDRCFGVEGIIEMFSHDENIVVASLEYRLAPEHPAPAGAHDGYAGLTYLAGHAAELGIDPLKIIMFGTSGGSAIVAATVLIARDQQTPNVCAQVLSIPMLDDRDHWISAKQFETGTIWDGRTNLRAWDLVLGPNRGSVDGTRCAGRANDLSNLPPTFIDVGECEVFRDSAIAYASQIWTSGGSVELHVWPGVYHGASLLEPDAPVSKAQSAAQKSFIQRALNQVSSNGPSLD